MTIPLMISGFGQFHTNEPDQNNTGKKLTPYAGITWPEIQKLVDHPQQVEKARSQWLIPSTLPSRSFKEQEHKGTFYLLWADFDESPPSLHTLDHLINPVLACNYELYTSRSATRDNQKSRLLIPLAEPLSGADWVLAQQTLNDILELRHIKPDRAAERPAQLCYLPNMGEYYTMVSRSDGIFFNPMQTWQKEIATKRGKLETEREALFKAKNRAMERRKALSLTDTPDLITAFNLAYTPQEFLLQAGYDQRGNSFRHPRSATGNYSATIKDGLVHTLSSSDPLYSARQGAHDAFSTYTILMHGGDRTAALKAAGDELLTIGSVSFNKALQIEHAKRRDQQLQNNNVVQLAVGSAQVRKSYIEHNSMPDYGVLQPVPMKKENTTGTSVEHKAKTEPEKEKATWEIALDRHIEEWNKNHYSVIVGGKHKIMRLEPGGASCEGRDFYSFYTRNELSLVYDNTIIQTGEKTTPKGETVPVHKNHLMAWAKDSRSNSYTGGVVFLPGRKAPKNYFNTWRGFSVDPKQNDDLLRLIYYHMENVVCSGHKDLYEYLLKWIAYTVQNPDKPAGAAIVLRGEKGSGKGTIGHFLKSLWANHGLHISNAKHLVGNFNGHLNDVCFLFADEAFYSGDKQHEGVLKALITEPQITVERKGIDAISQPNFLKVFMATNSDFAVPASKDERRYCVLDVSNRYSGNGDYFSKLHASIRSKETQSAFLYAMQQIDLSGWRTSDIPESVGLRAQRYHSMDSVQKWIVDCLINGTFATANGGEHWQMELSANDLWTAYVNWCDTAKAGQYQRLTQCAMGRYLGNVFVKRKSRGYFRYFFGQLDEAKAKFEAYEKISLEEL